MLFLRHKAVRTRVGMSARSRDVRVFAVRIRSSLKVSFGFLLVCFKVGCAGQNICFLRFWLDLQCWILALLSFRRVLLENRCRGKALSMVRVICVKVGNSWLDLAIRPVIVKHLHGHFQVIETGRINFANLLIGYFFAHDQSMQLFSCGILTDLEQFG